MAKLPSFGKLEFNLGPGRLPSPARPEPETPFRVLIMGDFSGRASRGVAEPLAGRAATKPAVVDCDNLDQVMARLSTTLRLAVAGHEDQGIPVPFKELEDFHPDRLFDALELFQALKKTRKELLDPATFDAAAAKVRGWSQGSEASPAVAPTPAPGDSGGNSEGGDSFEALLGKPNSISSSKPRPAGAGQLDVLLQQIVGPHVVHAKPQQDELLQAVDAATSKLMRAVLHDSGFQQLEANWRGLDFLTRHLETDEHLKLYVFDISKAELTADLGAGDDLESTGLHSLLVEQTVGTPGAQPWAVVVGAYTFDATAQDAEALGRLAKIAARAGAAFLTGASPRVLGCKSLGLKPDPAKWDQAMDTDAAQAWSALRRLPEAVHVGLTLPRYLLRLPYGKNTDELDRFEFEEIQGDPTKGVYLWGNPAFICGYLLGQAFSQEGWGFSPGAGQDVDDLPAHTFTHDGESHMTPCAEAWLSERTAEAILEKGVMPLLSIHGRDAVRLARFQSLAEPATNLAGRWG